MSSENWQNPHVNYDFVPLTDMKEAIPIGPDILTKRYVVIENSLPPFEVEPKITVQKDCFLNTVVYLFLAEKAERVLFEETIKRFEDTFEHYLIGIDQMTLEKSVVNELHKRKCTISAAESCTGGMLISRLIGVPGASNVIDRSFIVYSDRAKRELLEVDKNLLRRYGAVSPDVAEAMVKGVKKLSNADVGISVTGYAGGGETPLPEDGLYYFAISYKDYLHLEKGIFLGERNEVRYAQTTHILWRLLTILRDGIAER